MVVDVALAVEHAAHVQGLALLRDAALDGGLGHGAVGGRHPAQAVLVQHGELRPTDKLPISLFPGVSQNYVTTRANAL